MKLTSSQKGALQKLRNLTDRHGFEWWRTIFIGTHNASLMRRYLSPEMVEIRKQNDGYRYRLTDAGRAALQEGE